MKRAGQIALVPFPIHRLERRQAAPCAAAAAGVGAFRRLARLHDVVAASAGGTEPRRDRGPRGCRFRRQRPQSCQRGAADPASGSRCLLVGGIGEIDSERLNRMLHRLAAWLTKPN